MEAGSTVKEASDETVHDPMRYTLTLTLTLTLILTLILTLTLTRP